MNATARTMEINSSKYDLNIFFFRITRYDDIIT